METMKKLKNRRFWIQHFGETYSTENPHSSIGFVRNECPDDGVMSETKKCVEVKPWADYLNCEEENARVLVRMALIPNLGWYTLRNHMLEKQIDIDVTTMKIILLRQ